MFNIPDDCANHPSAPWNEDPEWVCVECGDDITEDDDFLCDDCYEEQQNEND